MDSFINISNVQEFGEGERLTNRLARMGNQLLLKDEEMINKFMIGICSRRMAEKIID